ncbi:hypothetical protein KOW79_004956 [Hemibagrus wyckioides]|uniref:Uncharacterized protein n=1 Tax=Hemibagrus wyckioides TaxID=337641 RepID=A0A9D3NYQ3_9TELE|nr:hypothetical protein KOW79_004956 [Hemibagrus wyckioides]
MRRKGETSKQKQDPVVPRGQCLSIRTDDKQRNENENESIYLGNTRESWSPHSLSHLYVDEGSQQGSIADLTTAVLLRQEVCGVETAEVHQEYTTLNEVDAESTALAGRDVKFRSGIPAGHNAEQFTILMLKE